MARAARERSEQERKTTGRGAPTMYNPRTLLAVVMLATLLAATPAGSSVPLLSTLQAQPADAHTVTKQITVWQRDRSGVCRNEWRQVIVGYETRQREGNNRFGDTYQAPIYETRWVRVCEPGRHVTRTVHRAHIHVSNQQCQDTLVFVAAAAAAAATRGQSARTQTSATSVTAGAVEGSEAVAGNWVTRTICSWVPGIIWLS